ncbi:uncharacterized protein K452DRAFT_311956 [Aplosporella prunicola CBS 121167]|uniref:Uncharacterized protein n=1 Tax=Aplosporella prunicola CBS 121167 TaxID=1176127 RepID=A0A6A6B2K3_9PEZI|nr:uncharacterized protein K452DRAFT_311956 [Aplosporella prunicola CBS 121167]KAF2137818.1 hypothetical protein K452DRAFT_311956 [Aplosporella prunicola CBS 121167]
MPFKHLTSLSITIDSNKTTLYYDYSLRQLLEAHCKTLRIVKISTTDLWSYLNRYPFDIDHPRLQLDLLCIEYTSLHNDGSQARYDLLRWDLSFADGVNVRISTADLHDVTFEIWSKRRTPKCAVVDVEGFYRDKKSWKQWKVIDEEGNLPKEIEN